MTPTIGNPAPGTAQRHRIPSDPAAGPAPTARPDTLRGKASLSVIRLLVVGDGHRARMVHLRPRQLLRQLGGAAPLGALAPEAP